MKVYLVAVVSPRLVGALLVALALVGCGQEASETASASATTSQSASEADDAAAVRTAFEEYKRAALAADGSVAAQNVASTIYPFYEKAREDALSASEAEVQAMPIVERVTVLIMRGSIPVEVLRTAGPQELLVAAVDAGLVGEQGISQVEIGDVEVDGDRATAAVIGRGQEADFDFIFLREDGRWKFDLLPVIELAEAGIEQAAQAEGVTTDQFVDVIMKAKYGPEKAAALLQPLDQVPA